MKVISKESMEETLEKQIKEYKPAKSKKVKVNIESITVEIDVMPTVYETISEMLSEQPTVDIEPVAHAKWRVLKNCSNEGVYCSRCGKNCFKSDCYAKVKQESFYCPNCGARMDIK